MERYPEILRTATTLDKGHGRIEERSLVALATNGTFIGFHGVKQVALLTRTREVLASGKKTVEEIYLISNIDYTAMSAQQFLAFKRDYWSVENKLHYAKDVVFGEDRSTIRKKHGPQNMASLRNFAFGLLTANDISNIKRCVDNLRHDPCVLIRAAA